MRKPTIVARRCYAVLGMHFLVTAGEIVLGNSIEVAKRRQQAVAAMLFRHAAQSAQRVRQALRQGYEALAAQHHMGVRQDATVRAHDESASARDLWHRLARGSRSEERLEDIWHIVRPYCLSRGFALDPHDRRRREFGYVTEALERSEVLRRVDLRRQRGLLSREVAIGEKRNDGDAYDDSNVYAETPNSRYQPGNTGYNPGGAAYQPGNTGYTPGDTGYEPPSPSGGALPATAEPHYRPGGTGDYVPTRRSTSTPRTGTSPSPFVPPASSSRLDPAGSESAAATGPANTGRYGDYSAGGTASANLPTTVGTVYSKVWHAVCSGLRKELQLNERAVLGFGHTWIAAKLARMLAASASVHPPRLSWDMTTRPRFRNQIGTLEIAGGEVGIRIEQATGRWTNPQLRTVIEEKLL